MSSKGTLAKSISIDQFKTLLDQYPALIKSVSTSKTAKPGQKSLAELDGFRYGEAVASFSSKKPKRQMTHEDVKVLVDWKLRHGKFRPTLMKLVSSNDAKDVQDTIQKAMDAYWTKPDVSVAVDAISKLRGVGPATASLLLAVQDPEKVIFFSDEAFYWLVLGGQKSSLKYTAKEYRELQSAADALSKRLGVSAIDIEKAAFVLIKKDDGTAVASEQQPTAVKPSAKTTKPSTAAAKRKQPEIEEPSKEKPTRRSKRGKT